MTRLPFRAASVVGFVATLFLLLPFTAQAATFIVYTTNRSAVADYNKNLNFFTTKDIATDGLRAVAWLYGFKSGGGQDTWFVDAHNGYGSQDSTPANLAPGTNAAIKVCARNGENGPLYHCVIHNFTVS